jgi:hypothetical protein
MNEEIYLPIKLEEIPNAIKQLWLKGELKDEDLIKFIASIEEALESFEILELLYNHFKKEYEKYD